MLKTNIGKFGFRTTLLASISLGMALTAAGCGNGNNNNDHASASASPSGSASASPSASASASPSASSASPSASSELPPVELTWYYPQNAANADLQLVNDAVNKITKEKINATVKLNPFDFGTYEQKMNTMTAAGEKMDIVWTSSWWFKFDQNQLKGAFLPLDDLLKTSGQKLYDSLDKKFWDDATLQGKIYAVPNFQFSAQRASVVIQKRFIDKYKLDTSTIKKMEDLEPFLKQIKEGEPGITPFGTWKGFYTALLYGIDTKVPVYYDDPTNTVLPDVTDEMRANYALAHSWYTKGYINQDAATLKSAADVYNKGTTAVWFDWTGKPGSEVEYKAADGGNDVVLVPLGEPVFTGAASTLNAISRTSENPERAMMFLELVNTDKELYNTLVYGIEGKHYTKTTGNFIKIDQNAGYFTNTDWIFGNITNEYLPEGSPADKIEQTIKMNNEARVSKYNGFVFNGEAVKTEIANVNAVNGEYAASLGSGTLDPAKYLPIYEEKLKKAGAEKIRAEKQKQLNEWLAANGKK
ncbi:ABC transporter substrate-binding protein [Cohnella ginsengisoli]|uniref:ABC transporter substrate-binding protein n=1 Tax=Cohnella ginsengisoli TaxID=425004 RepID=A0A9X4KH77_9BACL|nr:ABC transporter substrate-binding protein [Cohnella ginsengisoli]MDG0792128.1 ABC transporter substrate-binding protein [Cohnella ginsengisoli]